MIQLDIVERLQKELKDVNSMVREHQTALSLLQEKVDHFYDLVSIYNENKQENTAD